MAIKRTSVEAEHVVPLCASRGNVKRTKLSRSTQIRSESNEVTTGSTSETSARRSSSSGTDETRQSGLDSASLDIAEKSDGSNSDSDSNSDSSDLTSDLPEESVATDAEEESTDNDNEEIVTVRGTQKPPIDPKRVMEEARKLHDRLQEVLPRIKAANLQLFKQSAEKRSMENVDEGEEHIEMNLGLGVLEEQRASEDEDETEDSEGQSDVDQEGDVMRALLGMKAEDRAAVGIQEIQEAKITSPPEVKATRSGGKVDRDTVR